MSSKNEFDDEGQSVWATKMPIEILYKIFQLATEKDSLPTVCDLGKVCRLWNDVSLIPQLWTSLDLERWAKRNKKTEVKLKWIIENRLSKCQKLILSNYSKTKKIFYISST